MKLAFAAPRFSPEGVVGGAETLIRNLALISAEAGHEVELLSTCATDHFTWANSRKAGSERFEGITVRYFPVDEGRDAETYLRIQSRIDRWIVPSKADQELWANNGVRSSELIRWLEQEADSFDAILAGPYLFGITLDISKVAPEKTWLIPCLHDEPFSRLDIIAEAFQRVCGCIYNAAPEQELAEALYDLKDHRGEVVGMELPAFEADPNAFATRHHLNEPYVLYCGRREGGKNTPLLLEYMALYTERRPNAPRLVFCGSGEYQTPRGLEGRILDAGFVSESEKREAMAGAALFIHPSVNESFGIVLMEAWLAGTPALVHAGSEVLRWQCQSSGGGLWFKDYPEFECAMDLLLNRTDLQQQLGQAGGAHVRNTYNREAIQTRLLETLSDA